MRLGSEPGKGIHLACRAVFFRRKVKREVVESWRGEGLVRVVLLQTLEVEDAFEGNERGEELEEGGGEVVDGEMGEVGEVEGSFGNGAVKAFAELVPLPFFNNGQLLQPRKTAGEEGNLDFVGVKPVLLLSGAQAKSPWVVGSWGGTKVDFPAVVQEGLGVDICEDGREPLDEGTRGRGGEGGGGKGLIVRVLP